MSLEDEFPESRVETNRELSRGPRDPLPPFWLWLLLVSLVFGVSYYSCGEVDRRLNPDHNVTIAPTEILIRREYAFRSLHKNLNNAILAVSAFRWHLRAVPMEQWTDDLREEYDMHIEIVTGLRKACDVAAAEYNAQAQRVGPGVVGAFGFPAFADCEQLEVDTYGP